MKNYLQIFVVILVWQFILPFHSLGNSVTDSLLNIIHTTTDDSVKVHKYIDLCDMNSYSNSNLAIKYAQRAIEVADSFNYYNGVAKGYERMGNAYFQLGENKRAAECYKKAYTVNQKVGNYQLDASVNYNLGNIQHELGNYDSAIIYAKKAGEIFISNNDSVGYGVSLYLEANEYSTKGNYFMATDKLLNALQIFRNRQVRDWEIYVLNALVEIYNVQKHYDKSLQLLNVCLEYHRKFNNTKFEAITYRLMGDVYLELENYDRARTTLDSSYYLTNTYGFKQEKVKTMYSLAELEFDTENTNKAMQIYQDGLVLSRELDDELFQCSNLLGIGQCYNRQKKYQQSIKYINQSVEHALNIGEHYKLRDGYLTLSENYEALQQPMKALDNYKKYKLYNDSINEQENKRQFAELTSKYETEIKEQQITELEKEKVIAESNNKRVVALWILTIVVALLIVSILIMAYRRNKTLLANEKELDRMKSDFFANVSHEFRTPLTLILGPVHDLLKDPEAGYFHPDLRIVHKHARRLLTLINQILDLSKLDSGKYKLNIAKEDIVAAVKSTVYAFHSMAESNRINLKVESDKEQSMVNFDRENIETIINNLLSNAFKFEPEGGEITVTLNTEYQPQKHLIQLVVCNRGSYISKEDCNSIFNRYYQSENNSKSGYGSSGTGIGLALTRELVELHGGKISVESSKEKGTCFFVLVPSNQPETNERSRSGSQVIPLDQHMVVEKKEPGITDQNAGKSKLPLVLIVEDQPEVQSYIRSILKANFRTETANDGEEGVQKANELVPDLIVSDVMMPRKDGIELTHDLKTNVVTSHIPIILLTAKASVESKLEGLGAQADEYLTKPFNSEELKLRIDNILTSRQKLRERFSRELVVKPQNLVIQSVDEAFISKVFKAIDEHLSDEAFSVEELSDMIGLSRSQLHRKLDALTNKTASQLIREYRLERARELIGKNAATISEISYKVGFSSPTYFNKCFKDYFNSTPGDIKNLQRT